MCNVSFQLIKMIKSDHHNCLKEHHPDNTLRIMIDAPPLSSGTPPLVLFVYDGKTNKEVLLTYESTKEKKG